MQGTTRVEPRTNQPGGDPRNLKVAAAKVTTVYDEHHPPSPDLINQCVHCGFCLPVCPTYVLWNEEMDSPRGRIYLMKMVAEGDATINETWVNHFDACLG